MDVFHFKVYSSEKKKREKKKSPVFKDKWLFRFPKQFVLKHLYVHIFFLF